MNEQEKSLKLAELMGWPMWSLRPKDMLDTELIKGFGAHLCPYKETKHGLAQFAAILLRFPEVMAKIIVVDTSSDGDDFVKLRIKPTQANILDEILKLNGVEI